MPSFVLGDPWRTVATGRVPFWTFFPVRSTLESLDRHLAAAAPYRFVDLLLLQHGVTSPGVMSPRQAVEVVRRHGAVPRFVALDPRKSPHHIGSLARYGPALQRDRDATMPFVPLAPDAVVHALGSMPGERGRTIVD